MALNRAGICNLPSAQPWLLRFLPFLKDELQFSPERLHTVARMVLSATLTMLIVMTMRSPDSAVGVFFGLLISRENPASTLKSGGQTILSFIAGLIYTLVGVTIFVNDPLPHFLFIAFSLALLFFLIRTLKSFSAAFGFCFVVVAAIPVWDLPFPVDAHVDTNIWSVFGVILGVCVTMAVELLFCPKQRSTEEIRLGLYERLNALKALFQAYLDDRVGEGDNAEMEKIKQLARLGTSRLKWYLARSGMQDETGIRQAKWGVYISIVEQWVDTAPHLGAPRGTLSRQDIARLESLQDACQTLEDIIGQEKMPAMGIWSFPATMSRALPLLSELERKLEQLPRLPSESLPRRKRPGLSQFHWQQLFVADAFVNPEYQHFMVKGALTGLACYVFYSAVDWPGLGTSLATCVITALSTVGSSRQKQFLRIGGAIFGGLILGIGSQIYILPWLDTIWGFTIFFSLVTFLAAWITTASPRLSYFGLQMALAFYLIMLQDPNIELSLTIGRDRIIGTLLGLVAMWCIFDQPWARPAIREMREAFASNMRHLGELASVALVGELAASGKMDMLREQINNGFVQMNGNADMILFEFGRQRANHLYWRDRIGRWQDTQESLLLVQLAVNHYRTQLNIADWPASLREALLAFNHGLADTWARIGLRVSEASGAALPENKLTPLLSDLRAEALAYFTVPGEDTDLHRVEAILELDEQMVTMTEALIREVTAA